MSSERNPSELASKLNPNAGWRLVIVKRHHRAFRITGLACIEKRGFAWIGRNRRLSP